MKSRNIWKVVADKVQERILTRLTIIRPAGGSCRPLPDHREGFLYDHGSEHGCTEQRSRQEICRSWAAKSQDIYEMLMGELIS